MKNKIGGKRKAVILLKQELTRYFTNRNWSDKLSLLGFRTTYTKIKEPNNLECQSPYMIIYINQNYLKKQCNF